MTSTSVTESRFRPAKPSELTTGKRVEYRGSWGRGFPRAGTIDGGPFIENEEMVWDVVLDGGAKHWGYQEQFFIAETV